MEWIGMTIVLIILLALIIAFIGMWKNNTGKLTDYDLYGMDADGYLKKQVGEEYYNSCRYM